MNASVQAYVFLVPAIIFGTIAGAVLFASPMGRGQRLATELRGAHLVWWLAWAATFVGAFVDLPSCFFGSVAAVATGGAVAKIVVVPFALGAGMWTIWEEYDGRFAARKRYYLFWAKGVLPVAIALAPGVGYALYSLASGWLRGQSP